MRVAVTAASGRLGTAILRQLVRQVPAADVIAVARDPGRIQVRGVDSRTGDYESVPAMTTALRDADVVVLISAPVAGAGDRLAMHRNVIVAAGAAGVRKVIYTSVIGNDSAGQTLFAPFHAINRATEQALAESGLNWIVARNGLYLDLDLLHIRHAASHGGVYRNNGGDGRCGYISIDELGCALAALALSDRCDGRAVNLCSELHTQAELVAMANEVYGFDVCYEPITLEQNIARFMADERIAARGEAVARMLSGCFECIATGGFEVPCEFELAAGRPAKSLRQQMMELA